MHTELYTHLGVDPSASAEEIKRAYRKMALRLHPDKNPDDPDKFKVVTHAYSVLSDPDKRAKYDQIGEEGVSSGGGDPVNFANLFRDIFQDLPHGMFGGVGGGINGSTFVFSHGPPQFRPAAAAAAAPEVIDVGLSLTDVVKGTLRSIQFEVLDRCQGCDGTGGASAADVVTCITCQGRGQVSHSPVPFMLATMVCGSCNGRGSMVRRPCVKCQGKRLCYSKRGIEAKIPAGIPDGHVTSLEGKGSFDLSNGRYRDLVLKFNYVLPPGVRRLSPGSLDVHVDVDVSLDDVLCGFDKQILVYDQPLHIHAAQYVDPAKDIVVAGRGLPDPKGQNLGSLVIHLHVVYPEPERYTKYNEFFCKLFKRPYPSPPAAEGAVVVV